MLKPSQLNNQSPRDKFIFVSIRNQNLQCFEHQQLIDSYAVSTAKNGQGEQMGSECTPRGWHQVHAIIGQNAVLNSVFVGRVWTGEVATPALVAAFPQRDWILTRIIQLDGLEVGRNKEGHVDTLSRYIYIHGTPDNVSFERPNSHGCIRMHNHAVVALANWVSVGTPICIE